MDLEDEAEKAEEEGDLEMACTLWKKISARNQDPVSFFSYGRLATELKAWDEAEGAFARALRIDLRGREAEAEQTYRFVTSLQPENESGLKFFANFLEAVGKKQEAAAIRAKLKSTDGT
jgi:hypothetical protein